MSRLINKPKRYFGLNLALFDRFSNPSNTFNFILRNTNAFYITHADVVFSHYVSFLRGLVPPFNCLYGIRLHTHSLCIAKSNEI